MADDPTLRTFVADLDALELRRARARAFARSMLPHLALVGEEPDIPRNRWETPDPDDLPPTSFEEVARQFNALGLPSARGRAWSKNAVRRLMMIDEDHAKSKLLRRFGKIAMVYRVTKQTEADDWQFSYDRALRRHRASLAEAMTIADDIREALRRPREDDWVDPLGDALPLWRIAEIKRQSG